MPRELKIKKVYLKQNNYLDYVFNIHDTKNRLVGKLLREVSETQKNIVVSSTWNSLCQDLFKSLVIQQFNSETLELLSTAKSILMIEKNGLSYFNKDNISETIFGETIGENIERDRINKELQDKLVKYKEIYDEEDEEKLIEMIRTNHFTNREKLLIDNNELFDKIMDKYGLNHTENDKMISKKVEFQTDMNKYIRELYKPNVFLYTPSIKTGISFNDTLEDIRNNTCYFDKQYSFGLCGSVCVREYIQMIFRIRNLNDKCIEMCLGGKYKTFYSQKTKEIVYDFMKYEVGLYNKNKKQPKNSIVCNLNELEVNDSEYLSFRSINQAEYYNSTITFNQLFFDFMLNKHNFVLNENIVFLNDTENYDEELEIMKMSNLTRKEKELLLFTKTNIFDYSYNEYDSIKELLKNEERLTNLQFRKYKKYCQLTMFKRYLPIIMYYFLKDTRKDIIKTLLEDIEMCKECDTKIEPHKQDLYDILTNENIINEMFEYKDIWNRLIDNNEHYDKYNKSVYQSKYSYMKKVLSEEEIDIDIEIEDLDNDEETYNNETLKQNNISIIQTILKFLKIDNLDNEYTYINESNYKKYKYVGLRNELLTNSIVIEDTEYSIVEYIENLVIPKLDKEIIKSIKIEVGNHLNIDNNKDYQTIMKIIKYFLNLINLKIEYSQTNHNYKTCLITIKQDKDKSYVLTDSNKEIFKSVNITPKTEQHTILYYHDLDEDIVKYEDNCKVIYTKHIEAVKSKNNKPNGNYIYDGDLYVKEEIQTFTPTTTRYKLNLLKTPCNHMFRNNDLSQKDNYKFSVDKEIEYEKDNQYRYVRKKTQPIIVKNSQLDMLKNNNSLKDFECEVSNMENFKHIQIEELLCKINKHIPTTDKRSDIIWNELNKLVKKYKLNVNMDNEMNEYLMETLE